MQLPHANDARRYRLAQTHHAPSTWQSPSRLVLSQIHALLSAPCDTMVDALKPIVLRYLQQSPHRHAEAVQERGAALLGAILGSPFDSAVLSMEPTRTLQLHLAQATPVYDIIREHLASLYASFAAPSTRCAPNPALRVRASAAHEPLVITLLGALTPTSRAPKHMVAIACNEVGAYSHCQWRSLAPAIGTLAVLFHDRPTTQHLLRTLLSVARENQLPLAQAFVCLAPIEKLSPDAAESLISQTARVPSQHMTNYANVWNREIRVARDPVAMGRALACMGLLPERTFAIAIDFVKSDPQRMAWLAAAAKTLASAPPDQQECTLRAVLAVADSEEITTDLTHATILTTVLLAVAPGSREDVARLLANAIVLMDHAAIDRLAEALAAAHPQSLALIFEHPLVRCASLDIWRNLACLYPQVVREALMYWGEQTVEWRPRCLTALARIDDVATRNAFADAIFRLDPDKLHVLHLDYERLATALESVDDAKTFIAMLQTCSPEEGGLRMATLQGLLSAQPNSRIVEDAIALVVSLPAHALDRYERLYASMSKRSEILQGLAKIDDLERAHVMSCIDTLEAIDGLTSSPGPWLEKAIIALSGIEDVVKRSLVVQHLTSLQIGGTKTPVGRMYGLVHALASADKSCRQAWMTCAKALIAPAIQASERVEVFRLVQQITASELKMFLIACRASNPTAGQSRLQHLQQVHQRFIKGERPDLLLGGNVHQHAITTRLIEQISALKRLVPNIKDEGLRSLSRAMRRTIDTQEQNTPSNHPDRMPRPDHERSMFDEARHALFGTRDGSGYATVWSNSEAFNLDDGQSIRVRNLAALVWQAIEGYPRLAPPDANLGADAVARDKAGLRLAFIRALASCVEDNLRVCYAGKAARLMAPLEGWLRLADKDAPHAPEPAPPAAGELLSFLSQQAFAQNDAPILTDIASFVGKALALGESVWPSDSDHERARFFQHLKLYIEADHEGVRPSLSRLLAGLRGASLITCFRKQEGDCC